MTLREKLQTSKQVIRPETHNVSEYVGYNFANNMAKDKFLSFDIKLYAGRIQRIYEDTTHAPETQQWRMEHPDISPEMVFTHILRDVVHKAQQEYKFEPTDLASLQEYTERFIQQLGRTDSPLNCDIMHDVLQTRTFVPVTLSHIQDGVVMPYSKEEFCAQTGGTARQYDELCRILSRMRNSFADAPAVLATLDDASETSQFLTEFEGLYSTHFKQAAPEMDATRFAVQCATRALLEAKEQYADVHSHGYDYVHHAEELIYKLIAQNHISFDGITIAMAGDASLERFLGCNPEAYLEATDDFEALDVYHRELAMQGLNTSKYTQDDARWGFVALTPRDQEVMKPALSFIEQQFPHPDQREEFVKTFRAAIHTYGAASSETAFVNVCKTLSQDVSETMIYRAAIDSLRDYDKQQASLYTTAGITPSIVSTRVLSHLESDVKEYAGEETWTQFMSAYTDAWESRTPVQTTSEMLQCAAEAAKVLDTNPEWQNMLSRESHTPWNDTMARIEYMTADIMGEMIHFGGYQITDPTLEYHASYVEGILDAMHFKDRATFMELYAQAVQENPNKISGPIIAAYNQWKEAVGYDVGAVYTDDLQNAYYEDSDREDYEWEDWD